MSTDFGVTFKLHNNVNKAGHLVVDRGWTMLQDGCDEDNVR